MKNLENNKKFNSLIEKIKLRNSINEIDTNIEQDTYALLEKITIINKSKEKSLYTFKFNTFNSIIEILDTVFNISNSNISNIDLKNSEKNPIKKDKKKNNSLLTNLILGATAALISAKYLKLLPDFKTISEKFSINYETINNITNISKNNTDNSEISNLDLMIDDKKSENKVSQSNSQYTKTDPEISGKDLKKLTTINENKELDDLDKKEQEFNNFAKYVGNNINKNYPIVTLFLGSKNLLINLISNKITKGVKKFWNNISEYVSGLFDWMSVKNIVNPTFGLTPTFVKFINKLFKRSTEISNLTIKDSRNKLMNNNLLGLTSVIFTGLTLANPTIKTAETFSVFGTQILDKLIKAIKEKDAEFEKEYEDTKKINETGNYENVSDYEVSASEPINTTVPSGYAQYADMISRKAAAAGIHPATLLAFCHIESSFIPNANNGTYGGLFAINMSRHGNWRNPEYNTDVAIQIYKHNQKVWQRKFPNESFTTGRAYLLHQQGEAGGPALYSSPDRKAIDVLRQWHKNPAKVIQNNGGNINMTGRQFAMKWIAKGDGYAAFYANYMKRNSNNKQKRSNTDGRGAGGESVLEKTKNSSVIETKVSDTHKKKIIVKNKELNNQIKNKFQDTKIYQEASKVSAKEFFKKLDSIPVITESTGDNELIVQDTLNKLNKENINNIKNNIINENIIEPSEEIQNTQSIEKYSERNSEEPGMDIFDILINSDIKGNMAAI